MSELQSRLVPLLVEKEDFWARYFYRSAGGGVKLCGRACVGMGARGVGDGKCIVIDITTGARLLHRPGWACGYHVMHLGRGGHIVVKEDFWARYLYRSVCPAKLCRCVCVWVGGVCVGRGVPSARQRMVGRGRLQGEDDSLQEGVYRPARVVRSRQV
jgi:hypothetical protein